MMLLSYDKRNKLALTLCLLGASTWSVVVNAQDVAVDPTTVNHADLETCVRKAEELDRVALGVDLYRSCASFLLWFPGNRDACCNKLDGLVGPGAPLEVCTGWPAV
jgi:hypothetical protein